MNKLKVILLSSCIFLGSGFFSYNVSAKISPWKWPTNSIIFIDNVSSNTAFNVPIARATSRWRGVDGADINPIFDSSWSSSNDVHVSYAPSVSNSYYGYVQVYDSNGNLLISSSGTAASGKIRLYSSKVNNLSESDKTSVLLHEVGHVLGLEHTSNYSVMNESDSLDLVYPTSYDESELSRKY